MGTNYYAIPKADDQQKAKIIQAVKDEMWGDVRALTPDTIHIGKSSGGWQFIFNHHNWQYFDKTKESIVKFLDNCEIYDEYDAEITPVNFWYLVDSKKSLKPELQYGFMEDGLIFSDSTDFS